MTPRLNLEELIRSGESEWVEFKSRPPQPDLVARVLASFANGKGGVLIIGASESRLVGLSDDDVGRTMATLHSVAEGLLPWPIEIGVAEVEGKAVVYAVVDPAPRYYAPITTARGEVPLRVGSTISLARTSEVSEQPDERRLGQIDRRSCFSLPCRFEKS